MRLQRSCLLMALLSLVAGASPWPAQEGLSDAARRRIEREKVRQQVEASFEEILLPVEDQDERLENLFNAVQRLVALGDAAVPYLLNEIDAANRNTFTFSAYALGVLQAEEAIPELLTAVERSNEERTSFASGRKAWSIYALAMIGDDEAITRLNSGPVLTSMEPMFFRTSTMDVVAILTPETSATQLPQMIDAWKEAEPELKAERVRAIEAMEYVARPEHLPFLEALLSKDAAEEPPIRRGAVRAIRTIEDDRVPALLARLVAEDDDPTVRYNAAEGLLRDGYGMPIERVAEQLKTEASSHVRDQLYRLYTQGGDRRRIEGMLAHAGLPDATDRFAWVEALTEIDSVRIVPHLEAALADTNLRVHIAALEGLDEVGSKRSLELIRSQTADRDWDRARFAYEALVERRDPEAARLIEERLFKILATQVVQPQSRQQALFLIEWLVDLEHVASIDRLSERRDFQRDGMLVLKMGEHLRQLRTLRQVGGKLQGWQRHLAADDALLRNLAIRQLGRDGSEAAVRMLRGAYDRDPALALPILEALEGLDNAPTRELVRAALADPRLDGWRSDEARALACWLARRLGGPEMVAALEQAIERRLGRDFFALLYLAQLDPTRGTAAIAQHRQSRVHYLGTMRGHEAQRLDWMSRQIAAGRRTALLDVPPSQINLRLEF